MMTLNEMTLLKSLVILVQLRITPPFSKFMKSTRNQSTSTSSLSFVRARNSLTSYWKGNTYLKSKLAMSFMKSLLQSGACTPIKLCTGTT